MKFLPRTVVGRAVLILVVALAALHCVGYWVYTAGIETLAMNARDRDLVERIVSTKRAISNIPDDLERDRSAHALSSSNLEVHWSKVSLVLASAPATARSSDVEQRLRQLAPDLAAESFRVGFADDGAIASGDAESYRHMLLVSVKLDDGSWVNFASPTLGTVQHLDFSIVFAALAVGLGIIVVAALLLRWVTRPLGLLAHAAERFSLDEAPQRIPEDGPTEVQRAARAFNMMRERIQRLVAERTQALAAVSHDLRTPITRLQLRSEFVEDDAIREQIVEDLAEMEAMIDSALEFLRDGASSEASRPIDVVSVVETIVDGHVDLGHSVALCGERHALVLGKLVALKRAFANVIGNAVKYAKMATVTIDSSDAGIEITVADDGPGMPSSELERVFEPFYRLEESRNRATGGSGLGLTIARAVFRAHGGSITLENGGADCGLIARITLPRLNATSSQNAASVLTSAAAQDGWDRRQPDGASSSA